MPEGSRLIALQRYGPSPLVKMHKFVARLEALGTASLFAAFESSLLAHASALAGCRGVASGLSRVSQLARRNLSRAFLRAF